MGTSTKIENEQVALADDAQGPDLLRPLMQAPLVAAAPAPQGVVVGELLALSAEGGHPLVVYPGQPGSAALRARTVVDLHGAHIGRQVVLMFEAGDAARPIVMGVLRDGAGWPLEQRPGEVQVEADGERLTVSAQHQLVLRCGKASITLTAAGKVLVQGTYVSSRSTGVNRIKGGSVQLN
ncbi:DUF6484 domain-containing protein [Caldimonas brevitalea]|uniref:DUF6484 domain-containing protein n=1 Tax=Caldimonas brevitalea TaxID=413882 RepID=A0A0G3BQM8_9BURK|nr:DUF6484 domain-containing protein [Caldimonas brevitalea]AKJ29686.1 hypothetical protein AAW51_2995 [Caldimonas brevitalea]